MLSIRVNDVLPTVDTAVLADRGHQCSQQVSRADDEAELLAGMEAKVYRQQTDFDVDDLGGRELLDTVDAVGGHLIARPVAAALEELVAIIAPAIQQILAPQRQS